MGLQASLSIFQIDLGIWAKVKSDHIWILVVFLVGSKLKVYLTQTTTIYHTITLNKAGYFPCL